MKAILTGLGLSVLMLAQGCATPGAYGQFYQSAMFRQYPPTQSVQTYRYTEDGLRALLRDGYVVIGQSSFNAALTDQSQAIAQGKLIGVDVVLLDYRQTGVQQGVLPMMQYQAPQTATIQSFGNASGSAYGPGGTVFGSAVGHSTSYVTTPGYTRTQFIPYSIPRYDHLAVFLHKAPPTGPTNSGGGGDGPREPDSPSTGGVLRPPAEV